MPKPDDVIADPKTKPPTNSQNPLAAKPEKITSCGAVPIARNARKMLMAMVASGRTRVAKAKIPKTEIAKTCNDMSDVVRMVTPARKATQATIACVAFILCSPPIKVTSRFAVDVSVDLKDCGGVIVHRHQRIAFFVQVRHGIKHRSADPLGADIGPND